MIKNFKRYFVVYIFLLLSILTVSIIFILIKQIEYKSSIKTFRAETLRRKNAIEEQVLQNLSVLKLVQVYIEKTPSIKRIEFSKIVTSVIESNQSILAIEWIPRISNSQRSIYEDAARRDGFKDFAIKEFDKDGNIVISGIRDSYFPVYYLEPFRKNEKVFGFDISTYTFSKKKSSQSFRKIWYGFILRLKVNTGYIGFRSYCISPCI